MFLTKEHSLHYAHCSEKNSRDMLLSSLSHLPRMFTVTTKQGVHKNAFCCFVLFFKTTNNEQKVKFSQC
jgi:hypothetical protein